MTTATIQTVGFLPSYLQTNKNSKFLSSTLDQLIQPPQLEKLNAYIGSTSTPTYNSNDSYVQEISPLRQAYQLEPALIAYDSDLNVTTVVAIDDLANEISIKGGISDNFDRLFRSDVYSFDPKIDWDKLVNFKDYFWLPTGPSLIDIPADNIDIDNEIIGNTSYSFTVTNSTATFSLLNGMLISFSGDNISSDYRYREFYVEGTGTAITLVPLSELITPENIALVANDSFDTEGFSEWANRLPITPEYVTINRSSMDRNPWSRYNRWFSTEVVEASELANGRAINYPPNSRATLPIIEFDPNIQLFNFGTTATDPIDLISLEITDAFNTFESSTSTKYIDNVALEYGQRVIFAADVDPAIRGKIYSVNILVINGFDTLALIPISNNIEKGTSTVVKSGEKNQGTSWRFDGTVWVYAQQHTQLNSGPLFDLFDDLGQSYSDKLSYTSNWSGNKIFGYKVGTGTPNKTLGIPLSYQNINIVGSYLFYNYFYNDTIIITENNLTTKSIPTNSTYFKIGNQFFNTWGTRLSPPIEINSSGYYDVPLSLTNNPLNSGLTSLTLSDLTYHYETSTSLIASYNPIAFAMMFIGKIENNVIDAIVKSSDAYNQFKFSLVAQAADINSTIDPVTALDEILSLMNVSRTADSSYYLSDMLGYGTDKKSLVYTVVRSNVVRYALTTEFNLSTVSTRSVLVYLNDVQLTVGVDYEFDLVDAAVIVITPLIIGDVITINEYSSTNGNFVPPTPTKLGLYPAYQPMIYEDSTYVTPTMVIQGHDGSIMTAFGDYRDDIVLEYELRVYNNIKVKYRSELFDVNSVTPGAFRDTAGVSDYTLSEITSIVEQDFIRWSGIYGIDYTSNATFDDSNPLTWNYAGSLNTLLSVPVNGSWRSIFKYFYDTDRPGTHPWEMLGFTIKPDWWDDKYGQLPYTSGNALMWGDIEAGRINGVINPFYARPNLSQILPVDTNGNQLDPTQIRLIVNATPYNIRQGWIIGDQGPAETAWRRSSFWPFAVQRLLALTRPADYCSLMYDPVNMNIDLAGQWSYGTLHHLPQLSIMPIHGENSIATTGYSVFVSEVGQRRSKQYIKELRQDLTGVNFQLFHKVGGFIDYDSLQIIIDAYDPTTADAGAILPNQNYNLILNTSNPIRSTGISGLIIQRVNEGFVVTGYDRQEPYFNYFTPIRNLSTPSITIGGVSAPYVTWTPSGTVGSRGLSNLDVVTASSAPTTTFYQQDQIVQYGTNFYRVLISHQSTAVFNSSFYQLLSELPTVGGVTVQTSAKFDKTVTQAPYGQTYASIQEVYDLIIGYGAWLVDQGFVFNQFSAAFDSVIDWNLSAREFLYWTTQNWISNSIISLSPFADRLTYQYNDSVVDNVFDSFYDYSIYQSGGTAFPKNQLTIGRENGIFTIKTINTGEGIYHARLNSVQKEHGIVFDNATAYGDVIYNIETGQRQRRMKLVGFITANWNGDFFAPGFVYDQAKTVTWTTYTKYLPSDVVQFDGKYYSAKSSIEGSKIFDYTKWTLLPEKPAGGLIPNFDYKIRAFTDFYSLDIDSFDSAQQQAAQNLIGYTPRNYLNNIFTDPISQYKFYQGYIKEKGTRNPIDKLSKASIQNLNSRIDFKEEWALRVGQYGSFTSFQEFETPLEEGKFFENPQVISFVDSTPNIFKDLVYYVTPNDLTIGNGTLPKFVTTSSSAISFKLQNAGYAQLGDVTATAYDLQSLITLANNTTLAVGDTVWLSSSSDNNWDIYRYTFVSVGIIDVAIDVAYSSIIFTTSGPHGLSADNIISIINIDSSVNGIYQILSVVGDTQFVVSNVSSIINFIFPTDPGLLFTFKSSRTTSYDNLPSDQTLFGYPLGTKFWIDSGNGTENNGWAVYEKAINYSNTNINSFSTARASETNQALGYSISKRTGNDVVVVGLPKYNDNATSSGRVAVYKKSTANLEILLNYPISNPPLSNAEFGYSVVYDDKEFNNTTYGLIFAGAPGAYNSSGTINISSINASALQQQPIVNITKPVGASKRFGSSIFVQRNTSTKTVLVGAPYSTGTVYSYVITATSIVEVGTPTVLTPPITLTTSTEWGYSIVGSDNAMYYAISAPGFANNVGTVVANSSTVITSPFDYPGRFGQAMSMSQDGSYLAIGAPNVVNTNGSVGAVAIYTLTNSAYVLDQIIYNPVDSSIWGAGMNFGLAIEFNTSTKILIVSSLGTATTTLTTFDQGGTTFDSKTTYFTADEPGSGSVYLYERLDQRYVYAEELSNTEIETTEGTDYGTSLAIDDGVVIVGAPAITSGGISKIYQFNQIDKSFNGWRQLHVQDDLIVLDNLREIKLVDTVNDTVLNYYDLHDPLKGKILGVAEQELTYKTASDPAIYSIGTSTVNVNVNTNWLDEHVGELWWDLSSARFIWYEQGDLEYRRNNWGGLFPGSTIDVYEWVGSSLPPSEWAAQADTASGLTAGISGRPKFIDNTTLSIKQVFEPVSGTFSNFYYYWVVNKVVVPDVKNRRISAQSVANIIADPTAVGVEHAAIIDSNALILANMSTRLSSDDISLSISLDVLNSSIPRHTEWALVQEGSNEVMPPLNLERKMIESILGHTLSESTNAGALVPDPTLSERTKYGIDFRPQQTMFKDRLAALRIIVEFSNSVLSKMQVTGNYSFENLNEQQPAPTQYTTVEDNNDLELINPLTTATVTVLADSTYSGGWTVFKYDTGSSEWLRYQTQSFNTTLYWDYADWASADYNKYKILTVTVNEFYELSAGNIATGKYVKVKNRGDGNYVILERVAPDVVGNFGNDFNVVYIQNGTIQLSNNLWDLPYGWDEIYAFDQTSWSQTPDIEINYILQALKNNIFINDLKFNWNLLFFKAIKYAFTEHTEIDWAFKTSFINAKNYAGELGQPAVYKLQDSNFYEDYLNEIKPFRTQIREFTTEYSCIDTGLTGLTDFENTDSMTEPFRTITSNILFDRISTTSTIGTLLVVDNFIGNGGRTEFELSWAANPNELDITVTINSTFVSPRDYTIRNYTETSNGYSKQFSNLKFLNSTPSLNDRISISYKKSTALMDATDRINNFYSPTAGMPGKDLDQLMVGVTDPRKVIGGQYEGLGFINPFDGVTPDSYIMAGTFNNGMAYDALGINPADLTMDGGFFLSNQPGQALEEVIPGFTADTLGIDVYTKSSSSAPTILSGSFNVNSSANTSTYGLSVLPASINSIFVSFNGQGFVYNTTTNFTTSTQFNIDWGNSSLIIPAQTSSGLLGYTIIGVGDAALSGPGLVDNITGFASNTGTITIGSLASIRDITNSYVTVNGVEISTATSVDIYYAIGPISTRNKRAAITVYNLSNTKKYAIQGWLFESTQDKFNKIQEQTFAVTSNQYTLNPKPGVSGSPSAQVIVEYIYSNGTRKRLLPPDIMYYTVSDISVKTYSAVISAGVTFNTSNVNTNVYLNGSLVSAALYSYSSSNIVLDNSVVLTVGDTITVEAFNVSDISRSASGSYTYDYMIDSTGKLYLTTNVPQPAPLDKLRVVTFNDQDSLMLETQRFPGNPANTYKLNRAALNVNYVWVTIVRGNSNIALTSGIDYQIMADNFTVKIGEHYPVSSSDSVIIMSVSDTAYKSTILGYRQFTSLLKGVSFTRLANAATTFLTQPLSLSDSEIYVDDALVLSPPILGENNPGVILINGERIEFFAITGTNILSQLRRGTLGTSPAAYLEVGTDVIDQGSEQGIGFSETVLIQNTFTNSAINNYAISTSTRVFNYPNTSTTIVSDGIKLMTTLAPLPDDPNTAKVVYSTSGNTLTYSVSTASIEAKNQIEVFYGGRLLNKDGYYYQDTTVNYDSISTTQIIGSTSTVLGLPSTSTIGAAYLITATNQIWVYEGDRTAVVINKSTSTVAGLTTSTTGTTYLVTSTNKIYWSTSTNQTPASANYVVTATFGYMDSGLRYVNPEFRIINTTTSPVVQLNFTPTTNVQLTFIKKQYSVSQSWNDIVSITTTTSILNSTGTVASFLRAAPAALPDRYFYGQ